MDGAAWDQYYPKIKEKCLELYDDREAISIGEMLIEVLDTPGLPLHCPVHHFIVPAVLLTACRCKQGWEKDIFSTELDLVMERAKTVPGGACGFFGSCGAAVGLGIFWSVMTDCTPLSREIWSFANRATGKALIRIAEYGGPRCCKRVSYLTIMQSVEQINEVFSLNFPPVEPMVCHYYPDNAECQREACPFFPAKLKGEI